MGRLLAVALVVVAAGIATVVVVGPGEDKPEKSEAHAPKNQSTKTEVSLTGEDKVGKAGVGATVKMLGLYFEPSTVHVRAGQAVRFENLDNVQHTVYEDVGARSGIEPAFASNRLSPGDKFTFVPENPGTIKFICTLHPATMKGKIVVTGNET